jgi:hypothetical protein
MSLAQILGDCITKQFRIIKGVHPEAEVYLLADMLDPYHNCKAEYYQCEGDFTGADRYVPKEIIMVPWQWAVYDKSLKFFSERGFRTMAWVNVGEPPDWSRVRAALRALEDTPGSRGIIYCSWQGNYEAAADFGALVTGRRNHGVR